jgi:CheY-like chemotaxis protein
LTGWLLFLAGKRGAMPGSIPPTVCTLLIVDDEPIVRRVAAEVLTKLGYRILEAEDAEEALRIAAEVHTDLVLTDVVMPGMSGWELVRELQGRGYKGHFLLMSGYRADKTRLTDHIVLPEPFSLDELARAVRKALANGRG